MVRSDEPRADIVHLHGKVVENGHDLTARYRLDGFRENLAHVEVYKHYLNEVS